MHEKRYEVIKAKPHVPDKIKVGDRTIDFKGRSAVHIKDLGLGKELEARHGGLKSSHGDELRVIPVDDWKADSSGLHTYFWGPMSRPTPESQAKTRKRLEDDPDWVQVRPGKWTYRKAE